MSWRTFIRSHANVIVAGYFFTTEVWMARGLVTYYTLFFIDIATRQVCITGTTTNPTSPWMEQIARNLTDCDTGSLIGKRYLIIDRDALYCHDCNQPPHHTRIRQNRQHLHLTATVVTENASSEHPMQKLHRLVSVRSRGDPTLCDRQAAALGRPFVNTARMHVGRALGRLAATMAMRLAPPCPLSRRCRNS